MKLKIQAINELLFSIGERPVETDLDIEEIAEAKIAESVLESVRREVLSDGWDFNSDTDYKFPQDNDGFINIPHNALSVSDRTSDLIVREGKLYSKSNQSNKFKKPEELDVIWDFPFNELPFPIRNYITKKAVVNFQTDAINDKSMFQQLVQRADEAEMVARRDDGHTGNYNVFDTDDSRVYL